MVKCHMYPEAGKRCQGLKTTNMSNIHQTEQSAPVTFNSKSLDIGIGLTIYIYVAIINELQDQNFR